MSIAVAAAATADCSAATVARAEWAATPQHRRHEVVTVARAVRAARYPETVAPVEKVVRVKTEATAPEWKLTAPARPVEMVVRQATAALVVLRAGRVFKESAAMRGKLATVAQACLAEPALMAKIQSIAARLAVADTSAALEESVAPVVEAVWEAQAHKSVLTQ